MEDATRRAVFLSYASQDAEPARRICEALRSQGLEVWFDQNELVGGDAWDAKIRGQIAACGLFLPIISAHTQARREGYFRIEWRLAAQRTHAMADGTPFLVPIVIDGTRDAEALVPAEFKAVQWTRLPVGEVTPAFCTRVQRLLGTVESSAEPAAVPARVAAAPRPRGWIVPALALGGLAAVGVAAALWWRGSSAGRVAASDAPADWVRQAQEILDAPNAPRGDVENAATLAERATKADPTSAEAWAAWSLAETSLVASGDRSLARRDSARTKAEKAFQLAPKSFEARLSRASYVVFANETALAVSAFAPQAEADLKALLQERPGEPRALLALGALQSNRGDAAGFRATYAELVKNERYAGTAWEQIGWGELFERRFAVSNEAADRALALQTTNSGLVLKLELVLRWLGDLEAGKEILERLRTRGQPSDSLLALGSMVFLARNEPEEVLRWLSSTPRDWLQSNSYDGPTSFLIGRAHAQAGRLQAARQSYTAALALVEQRLAQAPDAPRLVTWKGRLLALLDRKEEAVQTLALAQELGVGRGTPFSVFRQRTTQVADAVLLGQNERALDLLEQMAAEGQTTWASLAVHPDLAPLRTQPRFQALLARLKDDPRYSPLAKSAPPPTALAVPVVDDKSVAVLPFANLSGDPTQEYFSDGLTEEILNALARERDLRVPGRTSSFAFKGKTVSAAEIAKALNVSRLVEGSVRRSGNKVRISVTLTRASDGFSEELGTFTEELTDIFALQDKIASAVVAKLTDRATVAGRGVAPTRNAEAYDLFLRARELDRSLSFSTLGLDIQRVVDLYTEATVLDPTFAAAFAQLSIAHGLMYWYADADPSPARREKAREALSAAQRLAPDAPDTLLAQGVYIYYCENDWRRALAIFRQVQAKVPNDVQATFFAGNALRRSGELRDAVQAYERSIELNPLDFSPPSQLGWTLTLLRRHRDLLDALEPRLNALRRSTDIVRFVAESRFELSGDTERFFRDLAALPIDPNDGDVLRRRFWLACYQGDFSRASQLLEEAGPLVPSEAKVIKEPRAVLQGLLAFMRGDRDAARRFGEQAIAELQAQRRTYRQEAWAEVTLGLAFALAGRESEALAATERGFATLKQRDACDAMYLRPMLAEIQLVLGRRDAALAVLRDMMTEPCLIGPRQVRLHPLWKPFAGQPEFERILREAKPL